MKKTGPRGRPRVPSAVDDLIAEGFRRDLKPEETLDEIAAVGLPQPSKRLVQDRYAKLRALFPPPDPSATWRVATARHDEVPLVLPVLAGCLEATGGRKTVLTNAEAAVAARVSAAAPDLSPRWRWHVTEKYLRREAEGIRTDTLDLLLGCAPWRGREAFAAFVGLVAQLHETRAAGLASGPYIGVLLDAARFEADRTSEPVEMVLASVGVALKPAARRTKQEAEG